MECEVNLKSIDLIKAISFAQFRNKAIWVMCVMPAILISGIGFVGVWAMRFPLQATVNQVVHFFSLVFGLYFVGLVLTIISLVPNPKWRKGRAGHHRVELTEKGIIESTKYNRSEIYWPSISKVKMKSHGLYFIHSGADAFIIPRKSFSDNAGWEEFKNKFMSMWLAGKNS